MYFHPGFAARNAVTAVELAEFGAYASESILEGEAGLFAAFRRSPRPSIALFADGQPEILSVYSKPVPACNFAQTACQAAVRVAGRLGDDLGDMRPFRAPAGRGPLSWLRLRRALPAALQAKMSIQFGVAAALRAGPSPRRTMPHLADAGDPRLVARPAWRRTTPSPQPSRRPRGRGAGQPGRRLIRDRLDDVVAATAQRNPGPFPRLPPLRRRRRAANRRVRRRLDGLRTERMPCRGGSVRDASGGCGRARLRPKSGRHASP